VPSISSIAPTFVRQGDSGTRVTLTAAVPHGRERLDLRYRLTLADPTFVSDTSFTVDVTVERRGAVRRTRRDVHQPRAAVANAVTLTSALAVKAPVPAISGTSPASVRQGDSGVTLAVDRHRFPQRRRDFRCRQRAHARHHERHLGHARLPSPSMSPRTPRSAPAT